MVHVSNITTLVINIKHYYLHVNILVFSTTQEVPGQQLWLIGWAKFSS